MVLDSRTPRMKYRASMIFSPVLCVYARVCVILCEYVYEYVDLHVDMPAESSVLHEETILLGSRHNAV
eukprot:scaffold107205_cov37-Tisochrysis_lutea.AAC.1